jgi:hypothetical protein
MIPNTDYVADRTTNNFCEEFKPLEKPVESQVDANDVAKKLFGDEDEDRPPKDPKDRFNRLFED